MAAVNRPIQFRETETECFEVVSHKLSPRGYASVQRNHKAIRVHRLIWEECFGDIPNGLCVCHKCDNPSCINPEHLFLGTYADNNRDRNLKGHSVFSYGEHHGQSKLTEAQVREIRRIHVSGDLVYGACALARRFGMGESSIRAIINRRNWRFCE